MRESELPGATMAEEALASRFARSSGDTNKFAKAMDAALAGSVKRHKFLPSGRCIYTMVGSNADEFIDPDKPFCSCESYFYAVLGAKVRYCYHILGYKIAQESGLIREVQFDDEEYDSFLKLLAADVLRSRQLRKT